MVALLINLFGKDRIDLNVQTCDSLFYHFAQTDLKVTARMILVITNWLRPPSQMLKFTFSITDHVERWDSSMNPLKIAVCIIHNGHCNDLSKGLKDTASITLWEYHREGPQFLWTQENSSLFKMTWHGVTELTLWHYAQLTPAHEDHQPRFHIKQGQPQFTFMNITSRIWMRLIFLYLRYSSLNMNPSTLKHVCPNIT